MVPILQKQNNMPGETESPNLSEIASRASMTEQEVIAVIELVKRGMEPLSKRIPVVENDGK